MQQLQIQRKKSVAIEKIWRHTSFPLLFFMFTTLVFLAAILAPGLSAHASQAGLSGGSSAHHGIASLGARANKLPPLEKGIIYPHWYPGGYSNQDNVWQSSLPAIQAQTSAQWLEMPILFEQPTSSSTTVSAGQSTVSVASFTAGVIAAHAQGYKVFFVPLMAVREVGGWAGTITFSDSKKQQAWFDSYWAILQPYMQAAAANKVEQVSIGTELAGLELTVAPSIWNQLVTRVRGVFPNTITYDMNFSSLDKATPAWLANKDLAMIGVSSYFQLVSSSQHVDPSAMPALWHNIAQKKLDTFAGQIKKPVLVSEIGYRNSSDALYQPWDANSKAAADPQEQAGAFDAAFTNIYTDANIAGVFVWGWDELHLFGVKGLPAAQIIQKWFSSTQR